MPVAVAETVNLVFDTWAVARALAVNTTAEHRTVLEAAAQDIVRLDVRARNPADTIVADKLVNLVAPELVRRSVYVKMAIAHRPRFIVTALYIAFVKVNRIRIKATWRPRLEPAQTDAVLCKTLGEFVRTRFAHSPTDARFKSSKHLGGKECSARNHKSTRDIAVPVQKRKFQATVVHSFERCKFALNQRKA